MIYNFTIEKIFRVFLEDLYDFLTGQSRPHFSK
jgi:hypothetical protein